MPDAPTILMVSHVYPFPGISGQQMRVSNTLRALRERFRIVFLGLQPARGAPEALARLEAACERVILLPRRYGSSLAQRAWHRLAGWLYQAITGLKFSNYLLGRVEFTPRRLRQAVDARTVDCVLYEYWHAAESTQVFRAQGVPCILDMHNVLWQSYARQLDAQPLLPGAWKRWAIQRYQTREERAWNNFDGLITINAAEHDYVGRCVDQNIRLFYAPMGIDMDLWRFGWQPALPPRVAYYGGLGSLHNQRAALAVYHQVMPTIWGSVPEAEYWIIGSQPPRCLLALAEIDPRVRVTGYVDDAPDILRGMSVVVCPWTGTYGFRSRLVEVMALGVPVVATPDAVYGMNLSPGDDILLNENFEQMAQACVRLFCDQAQAHQQSHAGRQQVERQFSFAATYGRLADDLLAYTLSRRSS